MGKCHTIKSLANPTAAPVAVHVHWLNTNTKELFYSVGTDNVADWISVGSTVITDHTGLTNIGTNSHTDIDSHISNNSNPHAVTAVQVGLGNVDNTSDSDKPVSTAQAAAIAAAAAIGTAAQATNTTQQTAIDANTLKASFPEAPVDGQSYARKDLTWEVVAASTPYQDYEQRLDALGNQGTTLGDYLDKDYLLPDTGLYEVEFSGLSSINSTGADFIADIIVDGVTTRIAQIEGKDSGGAGPVVPNILGGTFNSSTDQRRPIHFKRLFTLSAGTRNITVQFGSSFANQEPVFHSALLTIKRWNP